LKRIIEEKAMAVPKKKTNKLAKKKLLVPKVSLQSKSSHSIKPFLMFNANLEEVTKFYSRIFKQSKVLFVNSMQAEFVLNGQKFSAYNGGPEFKFSWGVSFMIQN
jgi:hypothetical protein